MVREMKTKKRKQWTHYSYTRTPIPYVEELERKKVRVEEKKLYKTGRKLEKVNKRNMLPQQRTK